MSHLAVFMSIAWIGIFATLVLFDLYRDAPEKKRGPRWIRALDFSLEDLQGFSYNRLALASILGLFLELLVIRWISSEIRIFAYFKNFVLIACFLGFGLGCYLCRRRINLLPLILPLVLFALLIQLPWKPLREDVSSLPALLGSVSEVHIWGVRSTPLDANVLGGLFIGVLVIVPLFALLTLVFIPMGQMVGWYLENAKNGILGYTVNILASLAGILVYTALCFFYQPPAVWFLVAGLMLLVLLWRRPRLRWTSAGALAITVGLVSLGPRAPASVYWSPYQKLTLTPIQKEGQTLAYHLNTNGAWYQQIIDLSPKFVASHSHLFRGVPIERNAYNLPYRFFPDPPSVLVLGSGMGNDVAAALRNGAGRVVAVEIDPLILDLGRRLHFERPYQSPRVQQVLEDARSYIQNSRDRFDLIVFSLLDSHTTSSYYSNIRIDNFVYTEEALQAARRLLTPEGIFIVKFQVETPWIAGRLHGLLTTVFGRPPIQMQAEESYTTSGRFFITGSEQSLARALSDPRLADYVKKRGDIQVETAVLTTDDWPYFYQRGKGIPASVVVISATLVVLCWWLMNRTGTGGRSIQWHFFFLGAGFLLLEAQIISKMALLFGTTWVINSIVIAGLLILIVASNFLVSFRPSISTWLAYAGIFVSIVAAYLIPLQKLFFESVWLRAAAATALLCLPVFFAGIVFIQSFARAGFRGEALGSNLLGALVGGLLESLSMWTGLKSLLVLAALLYVASYVALSVKKPVVLDALELAPGR